MRNFLKLFEGTFSNKNLKVVLAAHVYVEFYVLEELILSLPNNAPN